MGSGVHCLPHSASSLSPTATALGPEPAQPPEIVTPAQGTRALGAQRGISFFVVGESGFNSVIFTAVYRGITMLWLSVFFLFNH